MAKYICLICKKSFERRGKRKPRCCSLKCYAESMRGIKRSLDICKKISKNNARIWLGKKLPKSMIDKMIQHRKGKCIGKEHHNWNGGISKGIKKICIYCGKEFMAFTWRTKYCSKKCYWSNVKEKIIVHGYVHIHKPKHPFAQKGYVPEHRLIAEDILNRHLTKKEVIHHIDKNTQNNHPTNLYLFKTNGAHFNYHIFDNAHPNTKILKSNLIPRLF